MASKIFSTLVFCFAVAVLAGNDFRKDCLRELQKIKQAWPNLHYHTVTGALVLSPSPPRIAPSQLRLVEHL